MAKRFLWVSVLGVVVGLLAGLALPALAQGGGHDFSGQVAAPAFPEGLDWINVPGPLTWEDLRGKVVLLDFWTYGCINCIHIIPDLHRLEEEFADELVVIGVHSAKFDNEGDTDNIRQIVQRYGVEHPIVNDSDFLIWQRWGVQAWPTVVLIDPEGNVFGYHAGEGVYQVVQPVIAGMVNQFDEAGLINREPLEVTPEAEGQPETLLAFPGKVLADEAGGRLFIADSNHHRVIVADLDTYEVLTVIGGPEAGNMDGGFRVARFNTPQGMALSEDGRILYVTDTENHTVRAIDLEGETVRTIAGTGRQVYLRDPYGPGLEVPLNSPWDLVLVNGNLYIAMAGPHQLWRYDLENDLLMVHSGSGLEGIADGPHGSASLAQPSGITTDGQILYFADSESSAIREADVDPTGGVRTLVGLGLFVFGYQDGVGDEARFQHPLGVVYVDGLLYVADTYNSTIRILNPTTREASTLVGDPAGGYRDGDFETVLFDEPGGISFANGRLYVADTNNHVIRVIDLATATVSSVIFPNPEALQVADLVVVAAPFTGEEITVEPQSSAVGEGVITLDVHIPEGYKFNNLAPFQASWQPDGEVVQMAAADLTQSIVEPEMPLTIPVTLNEGETTLTVDLNIYYCEAVNETLCFLERVRINAPISVGRSGEVAALRVEYTVVPPQLPDS